MIEKREKEETVVDGLDVVIIDDNPRVCEIVAHTINRFYTWGNVFVFSDEEEAIFYCMNREPNLAIFIVNAFLNRKSGFNLLDILSQKYPSIYEDAIITTTEANDEIVDTCIASNISYLLEIPIQPHLVQFAVRAIVSKYVKFAERLINDPDFTQS